MTTRTFRALRPLLINTVGTPPSLAVWFDRGDVFQSDSDPIALTGSAVVVSDSTPLTPSTGSGTSGQSGGGGSSKPYATLVVASSTSRNGSSADYTCSGTDDHVTIQAAIDACPWGGKIILLEGVYNIGAPLNIGKTLILEGMYHKDSTTILRSAANIAALIRIGTVANASQVGVRDLRIENTGLCQKGIIANCNGLLLENLEILDFLSHGIHLGSITTDVYENYLRNVKVIRAGGDGLYVGTGVIDSVADTVIVNGGTSVKTTVNGIHLTNPTNGWTVINSHSYYCTGSGMLLEGSNIITSNCTWETNGIGLTNTGISNIITGSLFYSNTVRELYINGASNFNITSNSFRNCVVGILFNSCSEGVASSNTFLDTSGTGISVLSSHYIALESNILNMLTTSTGGIVVGAGSSNITLSNNYVSSKTIDTTASSGSNIVTGNTARGSGNVVIHSTDIAYGNYGNNTTQNFLQRKLEPEYLSGTVIPIPDSRPGYENKMYILQGNITIANPVVSVAGQVMKFWLKQNEVGSHTVTFGGNYLFGNFVMPTDVYAGNSIEFMCVDGTYWAASAPYSV